MALGILEVIGPLATAAIQAGGAVGAAVISSDAQKSIAKNQAKAIIQQQISEQRALLAQAQIAEETARVRGESTTQQLKTLVIGVGGLILAGLGFRAFWPARRAA